MQQKLTVAVMRPLPLVLPEESFPSSSRLACAHGLHSQHSLLQLKGCSDECSHCEYIHYRPLQ